MMGWQSSTQLWSPTQEERRRRRRRPLDVEQTQYPTALPRPPTSQLPWTSTGELPSRSSAALPRSALLCRIQLKVVVSLPSIYSP